MGVERRVFERYPCAVLGSCEGVGDKPLGIKCFDISAAGAGIDSLEYLLIGSHLRMNLCTKTEKPLTVKGTICWCSKDSDGWRAGVKFSRESIFPLSMIV